MAITTAMVLAGAAVAASVASAKMQSSAIKKAGRQQAGSADAAIAEQRRQSEQSREDFAPILERGNLAGERLNAFLGLAGPEAEQAAISGFQESPGQAFLRERQERALVRNESALGGLGGGNVRTALEEQAFGIASTQLGERKDRLAGVAALGAGATGQVGQLGQAGAANIGNIGLQSGANRAASTLALSNARRSGLANIAGAFTGSGGLFDAIAASRAATSASGSPLAGRRPSDRRLKRNIKRIGTVNGYPWYSFEYIWGEISQGVMSDEVPPEFVTRVDGFDQVDYSRII